jgi:hypothetical protein
MRLFKKALPLLALAAALSAVPATTLAGDDFDVRRVRTLDKWTVDVKFSDALDPSMAHLAVKADGTKDCPLTPEQGGNPSDFGRTSRHFYGDHMEDGLPVLPHNHYVWKVELVDADSRIRGAETARLTFCRALHLPSWAEEYSVRLYVQNVRSAGGEVQEKNARWDIWDTGQAESGGDIA